MRVTQLRVPILLLALAAAVPMSAGGIGSDITVPVVGFLEGANGLSYRTEMVITNHGDTRQDVLLSLVQDGHDAPMDQFSLDPHETKFLPTAGFATSSSPMPPRIGALHITALGNSSARIEANAFIIADRGKFGKEGSSRQEVASIASDEYYAEEAVFLGVRHSLGTGAYTNVGVVNLDSVPVTFYVRFQYSEPISLVVPPKSLRQIRIPGEGAGGRYVHVYPEWAIGDGTPTHTTAWVAYASTIDTQTGDAYSGLRVPSDTKYNFPEVPGQP